MWYSHPSLIPDPWRYGPLRQHAAPGESTSVSVRAAGEVYTGYMEGYIQGCTLPCRHRCHGPPCLPPPPWAFVPGYDIQQDLTFSSVRHRRRSSSSVSVIIVVRVRHHRRPCPCPCPCPCMCPCPCLCPCPFLTVPVLDCAVLVLGLLYY